MNIYQKLIEVRKVVPYLQKEDKGGQYAYVGSSKVLSNVRSKMDELGLLLVPAITGTKVSESVVEYIEKDKWGNEKPKRTTTYFTELNLEMTWINAEKPEEQIKVPWYGQGVDIAGEKGVGKALTYAEKYFLLKQFNIATDKDDPDSFQHDKPEQPKHEPSETQADEGTPKIDLKEAVTKLYTYATKTKKMTPDEYKQLKKDLKNQGKISNFDDRKWTEKDAKAVQEALAS